MNHSYASDSDTALLIQYEPALDIDIPVVRHPPILRRANNGKLAHIESHIAHAYQHHRNHSKGGFGPSYQLLDQEFQPLLRWADASWDYLLYTEGCRFVPRRPDPVLLHRSSYRAFTRRDYRRLVQQVFRECLILFSRTHELPAFTPWVRRRFWPMLLDRYRSLANPADARQRPLTGFSYLRCIPYTFLNQAHEDLVQHTLQSLPKFSRRIVRLYYLNFFTLQATAEASATDSAALPAYFANASRDIAKSSRLTLCLLRQIERY